MTSDTQMRIGLVAYIVLLAWAVFYLAHNGLPVCNDQSVSCQEQWDRVR